MCLCVCVLRRNHYRELNAPEVATHKRNGTGDDGGDGGRAKTENGESDNRKLEFLHELT